MAARREQDGPRHPDTASDERFDVVVVGGGPAGIAAALAASAWGARTLLVERDRELGGNVAHAFVHTICGLYLPSAEHVAEHAHPGLPRAFALALESRGGAGSIGWAGSAAYLSIDPAAYTALAREACERSASLQVWTGASLAAAEAPQGSEPWRLAFADGAAVAATTVVDASGDAAVAAAAGAGVEQSTAQELQHASYIFRIDDVDVAALDAMERARTATAVARAAKHGTLPRHAASITVRCGLPAPVAFVTVNLPKPEHYDPLDEAVVEAMRRDARDAAEALVAYLARERAPFAAARIGLQPGRIGIRETRRVCGRDRLEVEDVLLGRRRDDEACVSTWPVELWERSDRLSFRAGTGPCSIPLGALVARDAPRLATAGRCASASHEASGAIRVIGTSMAMGEAAGVACAMAADADSELDVVGAADIRSAVAGGRTTLAIDAGRRSR